MKAVGIYYIQLIVNNQLYFHFWNYVYDSMCVDSI